MKKPELISHFSLHKKDKESISVEIGTLSEKIYQLEENLQKEPQKDPSSFLSYRLILVRLVETRRKLLNLLLSTNTQMHDQIARTIKRLGLGTVERGVKTSKEDNFPHCINE